MLQHDPGHDFARAIPDDTTKLESAAEGEARVLWTVPAGSASGPVEIVRAVMLLDRGGGGSDWKFDRITDRAPAGMADLTNRRVTIRRPGLYQVRGRCRWGGVPPAAAYQALVRNSAVAIVAQQVLCHANSPAGNLHPICLDVVNLAAGPWLDLATHQASTAAQNVTGDIVIQELPQW